MRRLGNRAKRRAGFSLIEALMSTFIFLSLLGAVYSTISSSRSFAGTEATLAKMQMDGRKSLERLSHELRMTGWLDSPFAGEPPVPYIFVNGDAKGSYAYLSHLAPAQHVAPGTPAFGDVKEIAFRVPVDLDGNGLLTDNFTGEVEWSPYYVTYALITDAGGINSLVRREDGVITEIIARYVERITFDTIYTDAAVDMNEIAITIYLARPTPRGVLLQATMSTCVTMRNIDDAM
ncbi:MAG: PilW family protein [Planctomycetota bacterium]|jgi:hypothetical protein